MCEDRHSQKDARPDFYHKRSSPSVAGNQNIFSYTLETVTGFARFWCEGGIPGGTLSAGSPHIQQCPCLGRELFKKSLIQMSSLRGSNLTHITRQVYFRCHFVACYFNVPLPMPWHSHPEIKAASLSFPILVNEYSED